MPADYPAHFASARKFKVSLKNPRTGKLLSADSQYDSPSEARKAAEDWQEGQHLKHWSIVIRDGNGMEVPG